MRFFGFTHEVYSGGMKIQEKIALKFWFVPNVPSFYKDGFIFT